ncbi:MAG TPA: Asp-tRNA(Asn)/Glu-tRNA(Gln) amidotransferase subunit GatC [Burkholderiales bacterium]|jgi:aspartyl-tRNA(Asn)/glutamyl-tRNA(Gln) amidotransferase subunit C|nr:Asp-tRNA(Asn)/Glu-tRNA(Gln) amidotransferase subunit GatC [Burkholderiales bacterium]
MSLSLDDIGRIAHLARIDITAAEAERIREQLNGILRLIEQMQAVETAGVEPMSHPLGGSQRLREDVVTEPDDRDANMRNAPAQENGLFLVPRVIE